MLNYIIKRLLLMIPTLFGIMLLSFFIIQFAPGGPVERMIAKLSGHDVSATSRIGGESGDFSSNSQSSQPGTADVGINSRYRGAQGLDPEFIKKLEKQYGFDRPAHERFLKMLWDYIRFDFGESYYRSISVMQLIKEKLPVSISLGLWMLLIAYSVSIPLGIRKAVKDGSSFDIWTSGVIVIGYAIPGFLFAVMLVVLFAGGTYFTWFPLKGLTSSGWHEMSWPAAIVDYLWHLVLPITAMAVGAFATTTLLTKNSFIDEIKKQYVITARAKGLTERQVLYGHVFRNAMMIVISGFPGAFIGAFFTGALLIENIFSLDGLGLLAYESVINRDYPVVFATLYIFSIMGMLLRLLSDLLYVVIDPRIDFESREV